MDAEVIDFDAPPVATSAEEVLKPAIEEMRRRETVAKSFDPTVAQNFPMTGTGGACDSVAEEQRYALLTVGTRVMAPRPVDGRHPSLRIYGCFREREDATDHADVVRERDPHCSLVVVKRGEWFLFPQDDEVLRCPEQADRRLRERLDAQRAMRAAQDRAFDDAIRHNKDRPVHWDRTGWSEEQEEEAAAMDEVYKRPRRLRAGAEVRGQSVCALSVVPDPTERGEVLVKVLGCFDGMGEAEEWVQNVGSRADPDHDICLASTCEWLYPNGSRERTHKDMYRIGELQKIMDAAKRNPKNVQNFKDWKKKTEAAAAARQGDTTPLAALPDPDPPQPQPPTTT